MHKIGIGKSTNRNPREAGKEAALRSLTGFGSRKPGLVLVFGTAGYDQQLLLDGIHETTGGAPMSGCSTSGVITRAGSEEVMHAVAALSIDSDQMEFRTYSVAGFASDPRRCGGELAAKIAQDRAFRGRLLLLFPDGLTGNVSEMIESLEARLPYPVKICGGTAGELLKTNQTWQYHDGKARSDSVSAVLLGGDFVAEIATSHGCDPIGTEQTITRSENGWVYEIDGKRAWDVYRQYLEVDSMESLTMWHFCYICLAERLPNSHEESPEYIIRCPLRIDSEAGALFFPGSMKTGTRVRMALRSPEGTLTRARASAELIRARHFGESPLFLLQFDCCCRGRLLFGDHLNEKSVRPLLSMFESDVPWLGFNTYGEIAAQEERQTLFHNYSLVLCAVYPAARD